MGKVTRKRYSAEFKAKVALAAMKGEQTLAELGARHGIHQAIDGLAGIFSGKPDDSKGLGDKEKDVSQLHAKIGQLVVERDFLAKASGRWSGNASFWSSTSQGVITRRQAKARKIWR